MSLATPPATLLLAEDLEDDVFIMKRALKAAGIRNPLQVVPDGETAIEYLSGAGPYSDRALFPVPSLVFLDLMMPYRSGFDVLGWIKTVPDLASLPVVVLTSSAQERDKTRAYQLGARTYLVKPPEPADLLSVVHSLESYFMARGSSPFIFSDTRRDH